MKKLPLFLIVASLAVSGCATIIKGKTQQVNIGTSNNEPIAATIQGKSVQVPGVVTVNRKKENLEIATDAENCTSTQIANSSVEPTFWVNILSGGAFGSTTDYASDSMWKYDDQITINCK